jgi:hypothetical protein
MPTPSASDAIAVHPLGVVCVDADTLVSHSRTSKSPDAMEDGYVIDGVEVADVYSAVVDEATLGAAIS